MGQALFKIEKVNWDSNNFNLKVGNVISTKSELSFSPISTDIIKQIISAGQKEQYNLLYLKLPYNQQVAQCTFTFPKVQITLADTKVIYNKIISQKQHCAYNPYVTCYTNHEVSESILNLAFESGKYSRFKLDPNFPPGAFKKMYSIWIDKAVKGKNANNVLIYQVKDNILAMLTYSVHLDKVIIGLIAVKESHQGLNIGSTLLSSLEEMMDERVKTIEVATQKQNHDACNFYEKNQFKIKEETNIYHIWL